MLFAHKQCHIVSSVTLLQDGGPIDDNTAGRLSRRELFAMLLLGLTVTGQMADQNLLAPNLTAVR